MSAPRPTVDVLRDLGIPARTLANWLSAAKHLRPASMIGNTFVWTAAEERRLAKYAAEQKARHPNHRRGGAKS